MSFPDLTSVMNLPGMHGASRHLGDLQAAVQRVKFNKQQCKDLSRRCLQLLVAFRDSSRGMEGSRMLEALDEVERVIDRANRKAQKWAGYNTMKSFANQGDIKAGLDELNKDIDHCMRHFQIAAHLDVGRNVRDVTQVISGDFSQDREVLTDLLEEVTRMKEVIRTVSRNNENHLVRIIEDEQENESANLVEPRQSSNSQAVRGGLRIDVTRPDGDPTFDLAPPADILSSFPPRTYPGPSSRNPPPETTPRPATAPARASSAAFSTAYPSHGGYPPSSSLVTISSFASSTATIAVDSNGRSPRPSNTGGGDSGSDRPQHTRYRTAPNVPPEPRPLPRGTQRPFTAPSPYSHTVPEDQPRRCESPISSINVDGSVNGLSPLEHGSPTHTPNSSSSNFSSPSYSSGQGTTYWPDGSFPVHQVNMASSDNEVIINYTASGSVASGTVHGLVKRLFFPREPSHNDKFPDTFLSTYREFTTTSEILQLVQLHLSETEQQPQMRIRVHMLHDIINVLTLWLTKHYNLSLDDHLLQIQSLVRSITRPPTTAALARTLSDLIDKLRRPKPNSVPAAMNDLETTQHGLAIALTILEMAKYNAIKQVDFMSHLLEPRERNNLALARATNKKISNWVMQSILSPELWTKRGGRLKFFVEVAEECRKLRNYSSMSAILDGIEYTKSRLILTEDCLDRNTRPMLARCSALLDPKQGYKAYRDSLNTMHRCVPVLSIHIGDLSSCLNLERCPRSVIGEQGRQLVNFERYTRFSELTWHILQYQKENDLESHRNDGPLGYLEANLRRVGIDPKSNQALEDRCATLKKKEEYLHAHREKELRAVGW